MSRPVRNRPRWTLASTRETVSGAWGRLPHRWWWASGAGVVVVALLVWAVWPSAEAPRERRYLDFTACLLTGEAGIADPAAAPVWAGMQEASLATLAKVQYLAVAGPQTTDNAVPFINSLAQSKCNVIFAAGQAPVAAAAQGAPHFPAVRFYAVGGTTTLANLTPVSAANAVETHAEVARIIRLAVPAPDDNE